MVEETLIISNLQSNEWHSHAHLRQRQMMVQTLTLLMEQRSSTAFPKGRLNNQLDHIAGRLELILYSRSASFDEYSNLRTLRRRLRYLISSLFRQAEHENPKIVKRFSLKRPAGEFMTNADLLPVTKKVSITEENLKRHEKFRMPFFLCDQMDLIRLTYSFLNGTSICKHFSINRSAYHILKSCVTHLHMDLDLYADAVHSKERFFRQFPYLEELQICRSLDCEENPLNCTQLDMNCHNHGEWLVGSLAIAMESGDLQSLRCLRLTSLYANTTHVNGAACLGAALAKGSCPKLEELALGGNSIGDCGAVSISAALGSGKLSNLKHLDIRRNFIGEKGTIALCQPLLEGSCFRLETFLAEGNIIDDHCASLLAEALKKGKCKQITTLGLENNFIDMAGFYQLSEVYSSSPCPLLRYIGLEGNSIEQDLVNSLSESKCDSRCGRN